MSIIRSIFTSGFVPSLYVRPSHSSKTRAPSYSSSSFASSTNHGQALFIKSTRRFVVRSVVGPGAPLPPEPPVNFLNWIVGIVLRVVLPFFSNKWSPLVKIKNEIETAVEMAEEIVVAVEKVTETVEKAAEGILEDLPEGGRLRKAVDFVEHIAERANRDAHIVGDFIDKVQEVEEEVEECVESVVEEAAMHVHTTHKHHEQQHINGDLPNNIEGNNIDETPKQYS